MYTPGKKAKTLVCLIGQTVVEKNIVTNEFCLGQSDIGRKGLGQNITCE